MAWASLELSGDSPSNCTDPRADDEIEGRGDIKGLIPCEIFDNLAFGMIGADVRPEAALGFSEERRRVPGDAVSGTFKPIVREAVEALAINDGTFPAG